MKEDAKQELVSLKKEIQLLNAKLKSLSAEKEAKYKEKDEFDAKLSSLIRDAEALNKQKQELNSKIKELKNQREIKNKNVGKLLTDLQQLKRERRSQLKKKNIPSVSEIRERINNIEFIIQTQAISFEREKKYMEDIKALKAKEKEVAEIEGESKEFSELKNKIKAEKEKADEIHKRIQDMAAANSRLFEELTKKSKEILELKEQRSVIMAFLRTSKLNIGVFNKKLNATLKAWSGITRESTAELARRSAEFLHRKTEEVREKFKSKKKLTTEDILILQREALKEEIE